MFSVIYHLLSSLPECRFHVSSISEDIDSNGMATYDHACHKLTTPLCRNRRKAVPIDHMD